MFKDCKFLVNLGSKEMDEKIMNTIEENGGTIVHDVHDDVIVITHDADEALFNTKSIADHDYILQCVDAGKRLKIDEYAAEKKRKRKAEFNQPRKKSILERRTNGGELVETANSYLNMTRTITLNLMEFTKWTRDQVAALLCAPEKVGGADFRLVNIKPFYDVGFNGISIANSVKDIQEHGKKIATIKFIEKYKLAGIPITVELVDGITHIVNWIDKLVKTRFDCLWSVDHVPNDEGGLTKQEYNHVIIVECVSDMLNLFPSFSQDEKERLFRADFILKGKLDYCCKHQTCSTVQKDWYLKLADLVIKGINTLQDTKKASLAGNLDRLMSSALELLVEQKPPPTILEENFEIKKLKKLVDEKFIASKIFMENELCKFSEFTKSINTEISSSYVRDVKVPTFSKETIAKDLLPFLPNFKVDLYDEEERTNLDYAISRGSSITIVGPSGLGKTALISRKLGIHPGLFITCTAVEDYQDLNMRGKDPASYALKVHFETILDTCSALEPKSNLLLYATIRQLVQCNFIARLISANSCLDIWDKTTSNKDKGPFKKPLEMLAYSQWNGNTFVSKAIFEEMINRNWHFLKVEKLRSFTKYLIDLLYKRLEIKKEISFLIGIDEASIFSSQPSALLSRRHGTPRNLLSVINSEIESLKGLGVKISDVYCGTMFTTDMIDIVHGKGSDSDTSKIIEHFSLDLISFDQALEMLNQIYNVDAILKSQNITIEQLKSSIGYMFPTRRRIIGLILSDSQVLIENIELAFKMKWGEFVAEVHKSVKVRMSNLHDQLSNGILMQALVQYQYPIFEGKLIKCNQKISSSIVGSGLASPISILDGTYYEFDTTDPIFNAVAKLVINSKELQSTPLQILDRILSVPQTSPEFWEVAFFLMLSHCSGNTLKENKLIMHAINETMSEKNKQNKKWNNILDETFRVSRITSCNDFYRSHKDTMWAKTVLKEKKVARHYFGDALYFYCVEHHEEMIEGGEIKFGDLICGLYYRPSVNGHANGICFNFNQTGPICIVVSNKLHNNCNGDNFTMAMNNAKKSISYKLFYKNNYEHSEGTLSESTDAIMTRKVINIFETIEKHNRIIPIIAHLHFRFDQMFKGPTNYSENGNFLLIGPDCNILSKVLPENTYHLLRTHLFETASF